MNENKQTFFDRLQPRLAPSELIAVRGAYYMAKYGHRAQVRKETDESGFPLRYFEHVRRVAITLMDNAGIYDPELIIAALLHDSLEDCEDIDAPIIEHFYGPSVTRRVIHLTKNPGDGKEAYLTRLRGADPYTVVVKMCDRLDNMRSLGETSVEFQRKQVAETENCYLDLFSTALSKLPDKQEVHLRHGVMHEILNLIDRYREERT